MKDKKDFGGDGTIGTVPPTDHVLIDTGGWDDEPVGMFKAWRKKFKNYATYLTKKKLEG